MRPDHDHSDSDCLELFKKLSAYLDGETDPRTYQKIATHITRCIKCSICLETLKQTVALCKSIPGEPLPVGFSKKLWNVLSKRMKTRSF